jgi:hypothetical protein
MKLTATKSARSDKLDHLLCERTDGTRTAVAMPRQGILPHDLIHFVVESTLGYRHGFLGEVANGADIAFAMQMSHDVTHTAPSPQLAHAEAIVESLQAQLWSGAFDQDMFQEGINGACLVRNCAPPILHEHAGQQLYDAVLALGQRWQALPFHASMTLEMTLEQFTAAARLPTKRR